mgnify:CR=1 FL=1|tara:strand:+ start:1086 stop:1709 length:624 start_codon:yes stop_codon:yes gene_type:complete
MQIIITESQFQKLVEDKTKKSKFIDWNYNAAGQPIFDYIRQWEGDIKGNHIPYVYDDQVKWVYNSDLKMKLPPRYTGGTKYGTLTVGWGTTDPNVISEYMDKDMDVNTAKSLSKPDIQTAANCIKRWQTRAKEGEVNERKLTLGMYTAMSDIVYNMGCSGFNNTKTIGHIEKGNYKVAKNYIKNKLEWGHDKRREKASEVFCKEGVC